MVERVCPTFNFEGHWLQTLSAYSQISPFWPHISNLPTAVHNLSGGQTERTSVVSSLCTMRLCTLKAATQKDTTLSTGEPRRWGNLSQGSAVTSITLKVSEWAQTAPPTLKCHLKEHENALCPSEKEGGKSYTLSWFLSVETHQLKDQKHPKILHCNF